MSWKVQNVPELKGYTVEWAEPNNYYLSRRNVVYHSTNLKKPFQKVATINAKGWKELASNFRLAQRLLRFSVTNILPLDENNIFVTFDKSVGVIKNGVYQALEGLKRPCRVLRSACAVDKSGNIYFGEYLANDERGEMLIYRYSSNENSLVIAYTFSANSIKHIHGLYFDKFTDSIFCLTGDNEKECQILQSFNGCETFEIVGQGDETWRAVSILFDEENLYYGTDAEFRENHIYRVNRKTLEREKLGEVTGTVFYSKKLGDDLFFATTAENAPSQKENVAAIWHIDKNENCKEITSFKKDFWHPTLFQFGTIQFSYSSENEEVLYFFLVGVTADNQTFCLIR